MFNRIQKLNAKCYLYYLIYLSYRINKIKNIKDITFIIKNISFFFKNANSDIIITVLTDCLNKYPLNEERMRIISVLQQNYELTNGEFKQLDYQPECKKKGKKNKTVELDFLE